MLIYLINIGATSTEEVLYKFQNQRDTQKRLDYLRRTTELEKRQLEQKQSQMIAEIEKYKYTEEIDKDKYLKNQRANIHQSNTLKRTTWCIFARFT